MFLFKSCPRCRGDLNLTLERELRCLQCGHEMAREAAAALIAERRTAHAPIAAKAA